MQARKRKRTSIENRVRWNLENMFQKCPKPSLQQITVMAKQLGLEKDVSVTRPFPVVLGSCRVVPGRLPVPILSLPTPTPTHTEASPSLRSISAHPRWFECGSVTGARRGKDQALSILNEKSMRLQERLSQGVLYPFLCPQAPILVLQAMGAPTSPHSTPSPFPRVRPFPLFRSLLWALPCIQTEAPALPGDDVSQGKEGR